MIEAILGLLNRLLDLFGRKEAKKAKEFELKNTEAVIAKEEVRRAVIVKDENEKLVADLVKAPPEKRKDILDEIRKKVSS